MVLSCLGIIIICSIGRYFSSCVRRFDKLIKVRQNKNTCIISYYVICFKINFPTSITNNRLIKHLGKNHTDGSDLQRIPTFQKIKIYNRQESALINFNGVVGKRGETYLHEHKKK